MDSENNTFTTSSDAIAEQFRSLVGQAQDGISICDEEGMMTVWNPEMERITGIPAEEILGKPIWDMQFSVLPKEEQTPERLQKITAGLREFLRTGDVPWANQLLTREHIRPDDSRIFVEGVVFPIRTEQGFMLGNILRDIDQRVRVEEKSRMILQKAQDAYFLISLDGRFLEVNPAACELSGYSEAELLQMSIMDVEGQMSPRRIMEMLKLMVTRGNGHFESQFKHKDGTLIPVDLSIGYVNIEGGRLIAFARDLRSRYQTQAIMNLQSKALQATANAIVITDADGLIQWVNPAFTAITGYAPEEAEGQTPRILKSGQHDDAFYVQMWDTILAGKTWEGEIINKRKDGSLYQDSQLITPVLDASERITHFIAVKQNIDERKLAEETLQDYAKQLEMLFSAGLAFARLRDPREVAQSLLEALEEIMGYQRGAIVLYDDVSQQFRLLAHARMGLDEGEFLDELVRAERFFEIPQGIVRWVAEHSEVVRLGDVHSDPRYLEASPEIQSELAVPLQVGGRTIGVLNVESEIPNAFDENDERLMIIIANQAVVAIENAMLFITEQQRRREAEMLRQAASSITTTLDIQQVLNGILDGLAHVVPYDSASLFLREEDHLHLISGRGFPEPEKLVGKRFPIGDAFTTRVFETGKPIILGDASADPRFQNWGGIDYIRGWMVIPLVVREEVIGHMSVDSRTPNFYDKDEAELALAFANQAAIAIDNARLFDQAKSHAAELEQRVLERTDELQTLVNLMAGREVRMAELKKVIRKLRAQLEKAGLKPAANDPLLDDLLGG